MLATARFLGVFGSLLFLASALAGETHRVKAAGRWYPGNAAELSMLLDRAFEHARKRAGGTPRRKQLRALIVPHAGLEYSGVVTASAYRLVNPPRNIILLAFSHRGGIDGIAAPSPDAYETPLGAIPVNRDVQEALGFPMLEGDPVADHSLENQLPFLQRVAPEATLTPLYVGNLSGSALSSTAARLAARVRKGDLLIASSDFTHYGESYGYTPFPPDVPELRDKLYALAQTSFEQIGAIEVGAFDDHLTQTGDTICGRDPIRLLLATLAALDEDIYLNVADFFTSGDLLRDFSNSVGYGALAFYPAGAYHVPPDDQIRLLASARSELDRFLGGGDGETTAVPAVRHTAELQQRTGVFVTVRKKSELRGCLGEIAPRKPLWDLVADRTLAASSDSRFEPLTPDDRPLSLEISLLTPLKRIRSWRNFRIGYGTALSMNGKSGMLLPQLAAEFGWNEQQLLENLCLKAGLPPDAYKSPDARLYIYQAQVFREE